MPIRFVIVYGFIDFSAGRSTDKVIANAPLQARIQSLLDTYPSIHCPSDRFRQTRLWLRSFLDPKRQCFTIVRDNYDWLANNIFLPTIESCRIGCSFNHT